MSKTLTCLEPGGTLTSMTSPFSIHNEEVLHDFSAPQNSGNDENQKKLAARKQLVFNKIKKDD
jgi:hypothetical protein